MTEQRGFWKRLGDLIPGRTDELPPIVTLIAEIERLRGERDRAASLLRGETMLRNERDALRDRLERAIWYVGQIEEWGDHEHDTLLARLRGEE